MKTTTPSTTTCPSTAAGSSIAGLLAAALLFTLSGCMAQGAARYVAAPSPAPASVSTWPAPQEPLDTTPITTAETVGASRTE